MTDRRNLVRRWFVIFLVVASVLVCTPVMFFTATIEASVRKVLNNPGAAITLQDIRNINRYIENKTPLGSLRFGIKRQNALTDCAIQRLRATGDVFMLESIALRARTGNSFPQLLDLAGQMIDEAGPNAYPALSILVDTHGTKTVEKYVNLQRILASTNLELVCGCVVLFPIDTLEKYHSACTKMLKRADVPLGCKQRLLAKIVASRRGAEWFGNENQLLSELGQLQDKRIQETIKEIRAQMSTHGGDPHQTE